MFNSVCNKNKVDKGYLVFSGIFDDIVARDSNTYGCTKSRMDGVVEGIEVVLWQRSESGFGVRAL